MFYICICIGLICILHFSFVYLRCRFVNSHFMLEIGCNVECFLILLYGNGYGRQGSCGSYHE